MVNRPNPPDVTFRTYSESRPLSFSSPSPSRARRLPRRGGSLNADRVHSVQWLNGQSRPIEVSGSTRCGCPRGTGPHARACRQDGGGGGEVCRRERGTGFGGGEVLHRE